MTETSTVDTPEDNILSPTWDSRRDEVDIDTDIDHALDAGDDHLLPDLVDELIRLVDFQGRHQEAKEFRSFLPGVRAFAKKTPEGYREALFYLTQELTVDTVEPGLLFDKLLLWLGRRLEDAGDLKAALWAYTESEDDDEEQADRLREALSLDEYNTEKLWNEAIFAHYQARLEAEPGLACAWEVLALQHSLLDQPDDAVEAAQKALSIDPGRHSALQLLIEIWGERGEPSSLDALERQIQEVMDQRPEDPWPRFAMAEYLFLHREGQLSAARRFCEEALALAPAHEDANELRCLILQKQEAWADLAVQLEAMIARGEDRFQLYDLYDDLAEVYKQKLLDDDRADAAASRAALYDDAWRATEHVLQIFRKDPSDRHIWRVLRGLLHETQRWDVLYQSALERLDYEEDNAQIHMIYEDLFIVFQGRMADPPWASLQEHLQDRIDEEPPPALRLLLSHHLGWVTDQMNAEAAAQEEDDEDEEESSDSSDQVLSPAEAQAFAREWAFFYGHPWYSRYKTLSFGLFLVILPLMVWAVWDSRLSMGVQVIALLVGTMLLAFLVLSLRDKLSPPRGDGCRICGEDWISFRLLSSKSPVYAWARQPGRKVPYLWTCPGCHFDSKLVYQPRSSALVRELAQLLDIESAWGDLLYPLSRAKEGDLEDVPEVLFSAVALWNHLLAAREKRSELYEALHRLLREEMPIFARLKNEAPEIWLAWEEERPIKLDDEDLGAASLHLSTESRDLRESEKAFVAFGEQLALRVSHVREKVLAMKDG